MSNLCLTKSAADQSAPGLSEIRRIGMTIARTDYDIRMLTRADLSRLMDLQDDVVSDLQRPDLFEPYTLDWIRDRIENRGYILGAFADDDLAAFCHVYYPDVGDSERNYGFDIGFDPSERLRVVNLHMFCVHPRYRGNSLAIRLNRMALKTMQQDVGQHYHVCSSVSPYNMYSLRVLLNAGLHITVLTHKYGGKLRYIVYRDLRDSSPYTPDSGHAVRTQTAAVGDLSAHRQLLADGYRGVLLIPSSNGLLDASRPDYSNFRIVWKK